MEYKITMADVCELAHQYTKLELENLGITEIDVIDDNGDTQYTDEAQKVFDRHYDLITNTLGV